MKLSNDALEFAERESEVQILKIEEDNNKGDLQLILKTWKVGDATSPIVKNNTKKTKEKLLKIVEIYVSAYRKDRRIIDDEDFEELISLIKKQIGKCYQQDSEALLFDIKDYHSAYVDGFLTQLRKQYDNLVGEISITFDSERKKLALDLKDIVQSRLVVTKPISVPDFSFIRDERYRKIIIRDYIELINLSTEKAQKSVVIMAASIIEGLFIDAVITSGTSSKDAVKKFLSDLIHPLSQRGVIKHFGIVDIVRKYRNLVHPGKEVEEGFTLNKSVAEHSIAALNMVIDEVRDWYSGLALPSATTSTLSTPPPSITPIIPEDKKSKQLNHAILPSFTVELIKFKKELTSEGPRGLSMGKKAWDFYKIEITNVGNGIATNVVIESIPIIVSGLNNASVSFEKISVLKPYETKELRYIVTAFNPHTNEIEALRDSSEGLDINDKYLFYVYNNYNESNPYILKIRFQDIAATKYSQEIQIGANVSIPCIMKIESA